MRCDITRRSTKYDGKILSEHENYIINGPFQEGHLTAGPLGGPGPYFTLVATNIVFTASNDEPIVLIGYNPERDYAANIGRYEYERNLPRQVGCPGDHQRPRKT